MFNLIKILQVALILLIFGQPSQLWSQSGADENQIEPSTASDFFPSDQEASEEDAADFDGEIPDNFDSDLSVGKRMFLATFRAVSLIMFIGFGTYMEHQGIQIENKEQFYDMLHTINTVPAQTKIFGAAVLAASVAGLESGALTMMYKKFLSFLGDPKLFYFVARAGLRKFGKDPDALRYQPLLFAAQQSDSIGRGGMSEVVYFTPVFAGLIALGFSDYEGVGPFMKMVFLSGAFVTVAQTLTEVALANVVVAAKKVAPTLKRASLIQGAGTAFGTFNSIAATGSGVLSGLGVGLGTHMLTTLCGVGITAYVVYVINKLRRIIKGQDVVLHTDQTDREYWTEWENRIEKIKQKKTNTSFRVYNHASDALEFFAGIPIGLKNTLLDEMDRFLNDKSYWRNPKGRVVGLAHKTKKTFQKVVDSCFFTYLHKN